MKCKHSDSVHTSSMQICINVDTSQIDSLIAKLERVVELQKLLSLTPSSAVFGVDGEQVYSLSAGIHVDSFILGGTITASKIEPSLASVKELQDSVAAIITNATDTQHQVEQVNHQREKDFNTLSKALRAIEESITLLGHRDSFIR
ncbi:TPA: hypothetical protein RLP78_001864 [Yersinia enterocolitica]|nr:hypothetical protein [Yersinia enterocolitica]HDL8138654.1 hypothetical protein [Yersinia enterocolitica]HDW2134492.1 hypothetical protein [Yersinia enterocolitica]